MKRGKKSVWQKSIAKERIKILFKETEKVFKQKPDYAKNYMKKAKAISLRYRIRIPKELKRKFCKKCFSYLKPGISATVRLSKQRLIITCKNCGSVKRIPYKTKRKTK